MNGWKVSLQQLKLNFSSIFTLFNVQQLSSFYYKSNNSSETRTIAHINRHYHSLFELNPSQFGFFSWEQRING